ncbi:MAG: dihydropteroate synthase [Bryobacterales bacterium]|nr:dihydropteroate synthase [Bryobacterales bacterium]
MPRKRFRLELKQEAISLGDRTLVFHTTKLPRLEEPEEPFRDLDLLAMQAVRAAETGADVIDLSAMSLNPTRWPVSAEVELRSVLPMVKRLRKENVPWICVTTCHAAVAAAVLQAGATFINDPSGLKVDPELAPAVSQHDGALIIAHMRETPAAWSQLSPLHDPVNEALVVLSANVNRALRAGVPRTRILVDPGLGLGKRKEENSQILGHYDRLREIDYPVVMTVAGKLFAGEALPEGGHAVELAAATFAIQAGVHGIRGPHSVEYRSIANLIDPLLLARGEDAAPKSRRPFAPARPRGVFVRPQPGGAGGMGRKGEQAPLRPPLRGES